MLFSKVMVMCLGSVQFKACIQTCVNVSTPLVWVDGDIWLKARGWFVMHAAPWSTLTGRCVLLDRCITLWKYWFSNREACGTASELEIDLELTHFVPLCNRILCWVDQWLASFMGYVYKTVWQPVEGHMLCFWGFYCCCFARVVEFTQLISLCRNWMFRTTWSRHSPASVAGSSTPWGWGSSCRCGSFLLPSFLPSSSSSSSSWRCRSQSKYPDCQAGFQCWCRPSWPKLSAKIAQGIGKCVCPYYKWLIHWTPKNSLKKVPAQPKADKCPTSNFSQF